MTQKMRLNIKIWAPVLQWMLVITLLSSIQGAYIPKIRNLHPMVHWAEYTCLGLLLGRAAVYYFGSKAWARIFPGVAVLVFCFALFDEWHQSFVPGRNARWVTVLSDTYYAFLGTSVYFLYRRFKEAFGFLSAAS